MVANRDSIRSVGKPLCALIIAGEGASTKALDLAMRLEKMLDRSGTFTKQYEDHEERVLHRHLNLYKNKLAKAKTDDARTQWATKVAEQKRKIRTWEQSRSGASADLDLDGL